MLIKQNKCITKLKPQWSTWQILLKYKPKIDIHSFHLVTLKKGYVTGVTKTLIKWIIHMCTRDIQCRVFEHQVNNKIFSHTPHPLVLMHSKWQILLKYKPKIGIHTFHLMTLKKGYVTGVNKTKDQLWSLNTAQPVGNMMFKMELPYSLYHKTLSNIRPSPI